MEIFHLCTKKSFIFVISASRYKGMAFCSRERKVDHDAPAYQLGLHHPHRIRLVGL